MGGFNMEKDYVKEYEKLGVIVNPLPNNYDPDTYGKMLLSNFSLIDNTNTYSTETELIVGINEIV